MRSAQWSKVDARKGSASEKALLEDILFWHSFPWQSDPRFDGDVVLHFPSKG